MNPYSGLVDLFEAKGFLQKDGNRLKYVGSDGTEIKLYRKEWERNEEGCLDTVMVDFSKSPVVKSNIDLETGEILES